MTKERARTLEPRSGCLVDKVIVEALVKSVGQEMLVKVNINVLHAESANQVMQSWEDAWVLLVDGAFEDPTQDLGY